MGLLSSRLSFARYRVEGRVEGPLLETVRERLKSNAIREIDNEPAEKSVGWTCFEKPFQPDFERADIVFGSYLVFSLRIDKKHLPAGVVKKHLDMAAGKKLSSTGRSSLTKQERQELTDEVCRRLLSRVPANPNVYDVVWNYEAGSLWFLSTLKAANEELENIFTKSFKLSIIRMFPFTLAELSCGLNDNERDELYRAKPAEWP